jgi:hypothetical protein
MMLIDRASLCRRRLADELQRCPFFSAHFAVHCGPANQADRKGFRLPVVPGLLSHLIPVLIETQSDDVLRDGRNFVANSRKVPQDEFGR